MTGDREEDVIEVGGMDRQILDLDVGVVQLSEQPAQRGEGAVARYLQSKLVVVGQGDVEQRRGLAQRNRVGELQLDVAAGNAAFELGGGAFGDDAAVVKHGDPVSEPVGLVKVLGGEEDRDAVRDQLADQITVLDHGRIVAAGTPAELKRRTPGGHIELRFADPQALREAAVLLGSDQCDTEQLALQVPGDGTVASLRRLLGQLDSAAIEVEHLSIHTPDLDDVFFAVTGHPAPEPIPSTHSTQEALQR